VANKGKWNFAVGTIYNIGDRLIHVRQRKPGDVCCRILVTEQCVVIPQQEANIAVHMLSNNTPCPPSEWAFEPHMLMRGVITARMLLSNGHSEAVAHVCNYSSKPCEFKADNFLSLAEPVSHITGTDSEAVEPGLVSDSGLRASGPPDVSEWSCQICNWIQIWTRRPAAVLQRYVHRALPKALEHLQRACKTTCSAQSMDCQMT